MPRRTKRQKKPLIATPEEFWSLTDEDIAASKKRDEEWAKSLDSGRFSLQFKKSRNRKASKKVPKMGRTSY